MTAKPPQPQTSESPIAQRQSKTAARINQLPVDKLPHEQDESTSHTIAPARKLMKQAAVDLAHGLKDTDRGVEVGKTYAKQKR